MTTNHIYKFDIGDRVRCTHLMSDYYNKTGVITARSNTTCEVSFDDGQNFIIKDIYLEKVDDEIKPEIFKFKVGDKVRCTNKLSLLHNRLGIIESSTHTVDLTYYVVIIDGYVTFTINEDCLEKVEDEPKFKVGDRVQYSNTAWERLHLKEGVISRESTLKSEKDKLWEVTIDNKTYTLSESCLTKLTDESNHKYKVGEAVQFNRCSQSVLGLITEVVFEPVFGYIITIDNVNNFVVLEKDITGLTNIMNLPNSLREKANELLLEKADVKYDDLNNRSYPKHMFDYKPLSTIDSPIFTVDLNTTGASSWLSYGFHYTPMTEVKLSSVEDNKSNTITFDNLEDTIPELYKKSKTKIIIEKETEL